MNSLTSTSLIRFPFNSVPSSFLIAFFRSLLVANSKVLRSQKQFLVRMTDKHSLDSEDVFSQSPITILLSTSLT